MIFNYLNLTYYLSSYFFCCYYFGVSDPANIQVQIHEWCIHFSFVVILSSAYTCCFEFFHSFFHPGKAFNCPISQLYQNLSCKDASATQMARFNGQFSFLNLNHQHCLMQSTISSFFKLFYLNSLFSSFPGNVFSNFFTSFFLSSLSIVLFWGSSYRLDLFIYFLFIFIPSVIVSSLRALKTIYPLMTVISL